MDKVLRLYFLPKTYSNDIMTIPELGLCYPIRNIPYRKL